jgi:2-keto-3-deoxy-L-rhamnonate aldolase RhmA
MRGLPSKLRCGASETPPARRAASAAAGNAAPTRAGNRLERFGPDGRGPATAAAAIGATLPVEASGCVEVGVEELARRAWAHVINPQRNPLKEVQDAAGSVERTPPLLGIFNDVPAHKLREDEVTLWARAGFSWIVNDGEHQGLECRYGLAENAALQRAGLLSVQRLHREAVSEHGDALQKGARATMRPYATSAADAEVYYAALTFPEPADKAREGYPRGLRRHARGAYPMRRGDRRSTFDPQSLRAAETETQGWLQFETGELLLDVGSRDAALDVMAAQGANRACGFVGPFDAIMRDGATPRMEAAIGDLFKAASARGLAFGRVVGSGTAEDPGEIEDAMVRAIEQGARLICVHWMTSDLPLVGAREAARPFWNACRRCGF